jgi:hypothetical protein
MPHTTPLQFAPGHRVPTMLRHAAMACLLSAECVPGTILPWPSLRICTAALELTRIDPSTRLPGLTRQAPRQPTSWALTMRLCM